MQVRGIRKGNEEIFEDAHFMKRLFMMHYKHIVNILIFSFEIHLFSDLLKKSTLNKSNT